jgi:hypothetical protein
MSPRRPHVCAGEASLCRRPLKSPEPEPPTAEIRRSLPMAARWPTPEMDFEVQTGDDATP